MLFFKKFRKKIGVCFAMLGVLCCTAFGLCSMKGTSMVTVNAAVYDDNVTPNMFTEQFIDNCADTVNIFPSRALENVLESVPFANPDVIFANGLYRLRFVGGVVEDKKVFFEWSFANSTYNNHMKVGQTYTLVVKQYYLDDADAGNNVGIYGLTGSQTFDTTVSTSNDTISVTFTVTSSSDFVQLYYNQVKNDYSLGLHINVALYKGSVNYGVTSPLQAIVDSAYYNGQQAGGGIGGGYTQEDLDQAFQDGVNSVDTNAIRQEGYNAGYQAGLSAGSGTMEEVLQAEYERGFQAGVASIDQSSIRQEGYDEGYSAGIADGSGVSEETLQAEYQRGYQVGYESGYGKGVADSVAEGDYGVFIGSTWTYQAYDTMSRPPLYEQLQVPFENILKEGSKLFFNSTTLSAELNAIAPLYWNETHVVIDFATPVIKGGLLLGFDTSQLPVHFSITANGYDVKLVDNSSNPELSSRYVLDFSNVPDGTFIDSLSFYMHSGQGTKDRDWVFGSTALVTDINLYSLGYNEGYKEGEDSGYDKGYEKGDQVGYDRGFEEGDDVGYNRGYNTGVADAEATSGGFYNLISAVIDAPVKVFTDILDFELLGYNMNKFVVSLLTACLMIAIVKLFSGFAN